MFTLEAFFDGASETNSTRRQSHPSLGPGGSGIDYRSVPVPAPQFAHLPFPYRSPKHRLRRGIWLALACLGVAGLGAAVMVPLGPRQSDAAMAPVDQVSRAEAIPAVSPMAYAAVDLQTASERGPQIIAQKPFCLGPSPSDGSCVGFQLPKVRMVRVPRAASVGHQGNSAKSGVAAAPRSPGLDKETSEAKKTQRSAHRQNQRSASARREARVADWTARGYARSDYGRQGFSRNFW
jgi:hypothetical protein